MLLKPTDMQTKTHRPTRIAKTHRYRLAHKKLFSGFLCHLRYIGQLVYVVRSVKDTLDMTFDETSFLVACYATLHPALSVRRSVRRSVRPSVTLYFFWVFGIFGFTAPAQMIW